ncbi:MAG: YmaF family protein [Dehalobacter sp.]|nr:YmaF family protein [Dehalobacter sp.]
MGLLFNRVGNVLLRRTHVHEFEGSTKLAEAGEDRHNHRVAGVSGGVIPSIGGHRHAISTNTDFFDNHHHEIRVITGPPINVGNGKHVHFVQGNTTVNDGHFHPFQLATLIESPLTPLT